MKKVFRYGRSNRWRWVRWSLLVGTALFALALFSTADSSSRPIFMALLGAALAATSAFHFFSGSETVVITQDQIDCGGRSALLRCAQVTLHTVKEGPTAVLDSVEVIAEGAEETPIRFDRSLEKFGDAVAEVLRGVKRERIRVLSRPEGLLTPMEADAVLSPFFGTPQSPLMHLGSGAPQRTVSRENQLRN